VHRPFGFHLTNLILHAADTALLFWVLARMTGRGSDRRVSRS